MKGITIAFKNIPQEDGTLVNETINDCLIAQNGAPVQVRPQVIVHLPKTSKAVVKDGWFDYMGDTYHIIGQTVPSIEANTPTRWDRYIVAQKIY